MQKIVAKPGRGAGARPAPRGKRTAPKSEEVFVGIDLHKAFLQVAVLDSEGELLLNKRAENTFDDIQKEFSQYPEGAKYVIESSSVWRAVYRFMTESMGLDVVLSNPYQTWLIAKSKKKTDKRDARALADLLKAGLIQESYVPPPEIMDARDAVRFRKAVSQQRARNKMLIQSILLQESAKIPGTPFSGQFNKRLREMNDWRINEYLDLISACSRHIAKVDAKLEGFLEKSPGAQLLKTVPGVGTFTAIAVDSALGGASRFRNADAVVSYAGLAPSERSSGGITKHGRITRTGDPTLRWVLVEAAHSHVRFARDSVHAARYKRIAKRRGHGKAAVATAAALLRMMYSMQINGVTYAECVLQRAERSVERAKPRRAGKAGTTKSDMARMIKERDDEIARPNAELERAGGEKQ